jgi:translation initiation factor IF-2
MSKVRVYELAKKYNITSKEFVEILNRYDIKVKNHMSALTEAQVKSFEENYNKKTEEKKSEKKLKSDSKPKQKVDKKTEQKTKEKQKQNKNTKKKKRDVSHTKVVDHSKREKKSRSQYKKKKADHKKETEKTKVFDVPPLITVGDLASKFSIAPTEIIKVLMGFGTMATINQEIDFDTVSIAAEEMGYEVRLEDVEEAIDKIIENIDEVGNIEDEVKRPPVVTVMGHVDHGKTSLLDKIRQANVTESEAGGITQHIGAYTVKCKDELITFIDTPGHEAFTAMRSRGAQITDVAILVVAADDGVMPQTIEAINHAKAAQVPIIVAINKIDKPGANPDRVKQELTEHSIVVEEWGGDTIAVPVSAKTGEGIDNLLEMILLVSEMQELTANKKIPGRGTVLEAELDKGRGTVATLLIRTGVVSAGDTIVSGTAYGRIKAMNDENGKRIKKAFPSHAIEILGLSEVPAAGDDFMVVNDDKKARHIAEKRKQFLKDQMIKRSAPLSLDELFNRIQDGEVQDLNIIIKGDVQGSIEALRQSLEKLTNDEVRVKIIHAAVGAVSETDIMLATTSNAIIIGFNVRPDKNAVIAAKKEQIDVRLYRVIYDAIEDIQDAMKGMLAPTYKEVVLGSAEVRQTFKAANIGTIAGSYVTDGKINRNNQVRLIRDGIVVYEGELASLKRFKDDAKEVNSGYECGICLDKYNDIKEGDVIEAFEMQEVERD